MSKQVKFLERCVALNLQSGSLTDWLDRIEGLERIVEFQKKAWTADCTERDELAAHVERLREALEEAVAGMGGSYALWEPKARAAIDRARGDSMSILMDVTMGAYDEGFAAGAASRDAEIEELVAALEDNWNCNPCETTRQQKAFDVAQSVLAKVRKP